MLSHWKKILFVVIIAGIVYTGCNTKGILKTEEFFRKKNPDLSLTPKVCFMLGNSAYLTLRYKLAIDIIDRNLKDFPYDGGVVKAEFRRAMAYEKLGEYGKAIGLYEDFILDHPMDNRVRTIQNKLAKLKALHQDKFD